MFDRFMSLVVLYVLTTSVFFHRDLFVMDKVYPEKIELAKEYCKDSGVEFVELDMGISDVHCKDGAVYYDVLKQVHLPLDTGNNH